MIEIKDFSEDMLEAAGEIALFHWGGEIAEMSAEWRPAVYRYLARYYHFHSSKFNLAAVEEGKLVGFLMAKLPEDPGTNSAEPWQERVFNTPESRELLQDYRAYLEFNRIAEERSLRPGDLQLLFFATLKRGVGKMLLEAMKERSLAAGISSWLLWTDETCDFDYYAKRGFEEVTHFPSVPLYGHTFGTWVFRKIL